MPVIENAVTTLSNVKLSAGIASGDTSQDALLTKLINSLSVTIETYLGRTLARTTYTEYYNGLGRQRILLRSYPVQSVVYVKDSGTTLTENTDYYVQQQDKDIGVLFRPTGWPANVVNRGMTLDPVAGSRNIEVQYIAGYYMPASLNYVEGASNSLPLDISNAADDFIAARFNYIRQGGQGLTGLREGGLSYTWAAGSSSSNNASGLSQELAGVLNKYKEYVVA